MNETYPSPEESPEETPRPRNPWGWIVLALLFGFLIFGAVETPPSTKPAARIARYATQLKTAMAAYDAGRSPLGGILESEGADEGLRKLERTVAPRRSDPIEATVYATVRKQLGEKVGDEDLKPLWRDPQNRIFAEAFRKPSAALVAALDARAEKAPKPPGVGGTTAKVAANVARRELGLPVREGPPVSAAAGRLVGGLILASGLAWMVAFVLGSSGVLRPQGPATEAPTKAVADMLAAKAALLMVAFFLLQLVAGQLVAAGLDPRVGSGLAYAAMLLVVPLALRREPGLARIGLSGRTLGRDVGLGLWAFLLEAPVTLLLALATARLFQNLPTPEHPATNALTNSPNVGTIVVTFLGGAIVAPFWEEAMFRGLFFPALRGYVGPILAALVSSFLFASIHPQGPALWAALASVALFSCALAQTTRSLVPSIVMHFAHNATLMALTLLMGR